MLIIFDCDGVLVDSERLAADVFAQQLALENIVLSAPECLSKFKGLTLDACVEAIEDEHHRSLPPHFLGKLKEATRARFARELQPVAGIQAMLAWSAAAGHARCVASNGGTDKIAHSLTVTGLNGYFDHIFSADQVARGKPAPDLFLLAARSLGFPPAQCVVVEDSPTGVRAALAAGMQPLLYLDGGEGGAGACEVAGVPTFTAMAQLPALLDLHRP